MNGSFSKSVTLAERHLLAESKAGRKNGVEKDC